MGKSNQYKGLKNVILLKLKTNFGEIWSDFAHSAVQTDPSVMERALNQVTKAKAHFYYLSYYAVYTR